MFKIGDFAKLSRVSVKMLRHYDEIDLFKPTWVDPFTDYRYYSADQLPRLHRIIALKDLGFQLEQIGRLLCEDLSAAEIRGMLKLKRAEIEQELEAQQARLVAVEARLRQIEAEVEHHPYDVVLRSVAPQQIASICEVVVQPKRIESLFHEVEMFAATERARAAEPPLLIHHCSVIEDDEAEVEVAVPLTKRLHSNRYVTVRELEAVETMACVIHVGNYSTLGRAFDALTLWIEANGYSIVGPLREVYVRFSAEGLNLSLPREYLTDAAEEFITELQVPVRRHNRSDSDNGGGSNVSF